MLSTTGNVIHYCQGDLQWGNHLLGRQKTIQQAGCLVTSIAMLASAMTGTTYTPLEVDKYLDDNDGYSGDSVIWQKAHDFISFAGAHLEKKEVIQLYIKSLKEIDWSTFEGKTYPLLEVKTKEGHHHWVLLLTKEGQCNDPAHANGKNVSIQGQGYKPLRVVWIY